MSDTPTDYSELLAAVESMQTEREVLIEVLTHQQQALTDIREHVRLYNGKPFLLKDVETRIQSIHARPWYESDLRTKLREVVRAGDELHRNLIDPSVVYGVKESVLERWQRVTKDIER